MRHFKADILEMDEFTYAGIDNERTANVGRSDDEYIWPLNAKFHGLINLIFVRDLPGSVTPPAAVCLNVVAHLFPALSNWFSEMPNTQSRKQLILKRLLEL